MLGCEWRPPSPPLRTSGARVPSAVDHPGTGSTAGLRPRDAAHTPGELTWGLLAKNDMASLLEQEATSTGLLRPPYCHRKEMKALRA